MNCRSWSPKWTNGNLQITHRMYWAKTIIFFSFTLCACVNWRYCNSASVWFGMVFLFAVFSFVCLFVCLIACLLRIHTEHCTLDVRFFLFLNNFCKCLLLLPLLLFRFRHFYHAMYTCKKEPAHSIPSCNEFCHEISFYRVKWAWYDIIIEFFRNRLIQFSRWMSAFWFEHERTRRTARCVCIVICMLAAAPLLFVLWPPSPLPSSPLLLLVVRLFPEEFETCSSQLITIEWNSMQILAKCILIVENSIFLPFTSSFPLSFFLSDSSLPRSHSRIHFMISADLLSKEEMSKINCRKKLKMMIRFSSFFFCFRIWNHLDIACMWPERL